MNKLLLFGLVYCMFAASGVQAGEGRIAIEDTPLSVEIPSGFVLNRSIHTDSPSIYFSLPKGPDGGTPGYPSLSVSQINPIREPETLDSYIEGLQSNEYARVFLHVSSDTHLYALRRHLLLRTRGRDFRVC